MDEARKNRDQARTLLLSTILADLQNRDIELQHPVSDADAIEVLRRGIKRRREAIEMYAKGGRKDLEAKEAAEIKIIEEYLPAAASEEDVRRAVEEAIQETGAASMKDMGKVMKATLARLAGKSADGSRVSQLVKEKLS